MKKLSKIVLFIVILLFFVVLVREAGAFPNRTREDVKLNKFFSVKVKKNGVEYICFYEYNERMTRWFFVYTGKNKDVYDVLCIESSFLNGY